MSVSKPNIHLDYNVPVTFKRSSDGKVLIIQGTAIDDTVNEIVGRSPLKNYLISSLLAKMLRFVLTMATEWKTSKASSIFCIRPKHQLTAELLFLLRVRLAAMRNCSQKSSENTSTVLAHVFLGKLTAAYVVLVQETTK